MNHIIRNLQDPSWWFTGVFFVALGILITFLITKWFPAWYKKTAEHLPRLLNNFIRRQKLERLKIIKRKRHCSVLINAEVINFYTFSVIVTVYGFFVLFMFLLTPDGGDLIKSRLSVPVSVMIVFMYVLGVISIRRKKFIQSLLKSHKRVCITTH